MPGVRLRQNSADLVSLRNMSAKPAAALAEPPARVALLAGASGFVGARLLQVLIQSPDYSRICAVTRRPLSQQHVRVANRVVQFDRLATQLAGLRCNDAFCCLGSTLRQSGSEAERRKVDVDLVLTFANAALTFGATRLVVLSSAGADPNSRKTYLRDKGELEAALRPLKFNSLDILRPGLLLGLRSEIRPMELAAAALMPLVNPLLRGKHSRWRGISADELAFSMLGAARSQRRGVYVYEGLHLQKLAEVGRRRT